MSERTRLLEKLISYEQPIDSVLTLLKEFPWDSEHELVFLSVAPFDKILRLFVHGRISSIEVEQWANAIEGREDIGFEGDTELPRAVLHELANPDLTQILTVPRAKDLLTKLGY